MVKKKVIQAKDDTCIRSHLDSLVESLSGSKSKNISHRAVFIMSVHLIDVDDNLKRFCRINGINISYCGYMATFFKGDKDKLLLLKEKLPENQQDCTIIRV